MEESKTGEIKARVYDMSGLRLCLYGLILTVININIQAFAIFAFIAMILFLLLINHAYRSIDGKEYREI